MMRAFSRISCLALRCKSLLVTYPTLRKPIAKTRNRTRLNFTISFISSTSQRGIENCERVLPVTPALAFQGAGRDPTRGALADDLPPRVGKRRPQDAAENVARNPCAKP